MEEEVLKILNEFFIKDLSNIIIKYLSSYEINEFDLKYIKKPFSILISGKENNNLINKIIHLNRDIPIKMSISPDRYALIDSLFSHRDYSEELLDRFITRQKIISEKYYKNKSIDPRALIVIDTFRPFTYKKIYSLFMNAKSNHITIIISAKDTDIPMCIFENIDYFFFYKISLKKRIYEIFGETYLSLKEFNKIIDVIIKNKYCFVLQNDLISFRSNKVEDKYYWYK